MSINIEKKQANFILSALIVLAVFFQALIPAGFMPQQNSLNSDKIEMVIEEMIFW